MRDPHVMKGAILRDTFSGQLVRIPKLNGVQGFRELRELKLLKMVQSQEDLSDLQLLK